MKTRLTLILSLLSAICLVAPVRAATPVPLDQLISTNGSLTVGDKKFSDFGFGGDTNKIRPSDILVETLMFPGGYLGLRFSGNMVANGTDLDFALFYSAQTTNGLPLITQIGQSFMLTGTGNGGFILIGESIFDLGFFVGSTVAHSSIGFADFVDPPGEPQLGDDLIVNPPLRKVWVTKDVHLFANDTNSTVGVLNLDQNYCQNILSLICGPNKVVECGTPWDFDPPTATNF